MYAVLGDIEFNLITYFDGFESRSAADFAEHSLIDGKPRLQWIGDALDKIHIALSFDRYFCDPETEITRLKSTLTTHQAMALVLGNGDYKGWFVLTEVTVTARQTDPQGAITSAEASITLREFVGDKVNPLPPPAVRPVWPPVGARTSGAASVAAGAVAAPKLAGTPVFSAIRQGVTLAKQAQASLSAVSNTVRVVQGLDSNPIAALTRMPGVLRELGHVAAPIGKIAPALASVSDQISDAAQLARAASRAVNSVRDAKAALSSVNIGNVAGSIDTAARCLSDAGGAFKAASSATACLASYVATRRAL